MAFKFVVFCAALACANAGLIGAPVAYSPAAAVSSSYIQQAAAPVAAYAAPVATYAKTLAPVATYAAAPVAVHAPAVGQTSQSVVRSLGGAQAVSHYSKAVDSAFSSVRKYDTRITNDALSYAHAPVATYAAAPVATYAKTLAAPVATYAAAPVATYAKTLAAPVATYAHAAPVATYAHAAPVVAKAAIAYSPAAVVSHTTFEGLGAHYAF